MTTMIILMAKIMMYNNDNYGDHTIEDVPKMAVSLKYYIESIGKLENFGRLKLPLYRRNGKICEAF